MYLLSHKFDYYIMKQYRNFVNTGSFHANYMVLDSFVLTDKKKFESDDVT